MFRLAICDDHKEIGASLERDLLQICKELGAEAEIEVYESGERLCEELNAGGLFNLIFLDIELLALNGIDVGNIIREKDNFSTQIVYISSKTQYAMELFSISPLDFLIKPLKYEKIKAVVAKFLNISHYWSDIFIYRFGDESYQVKVSDIIYLESDKRFINIFLTDKTGKFYGKLDDVYNTHLKKHGFFKTHASFLVNYSHIKAFHYDAIIMSNGVEIPVSQANRKKLREIQINFEKEGKIW